MAIIVLRLEDGWFELEKRYKRLRKTPNTELNSFSVQSNQQLYFMGCIPLSKSDKNAKTSMQKTMLQLSTINNNFIVHRKIEPNSTVQ